MIISVGVDIVDVERVERLWRERSDAFLNRVYTPGERRYCLAGPRPGERLAARFAAKEAVMKCLGTGHSGGVGFRQVEVQRRETGEVSVRLSGRALEVSLELGIDRIHLSLSHTGAMAVAQVVACSASPRDG